MKITCERCRKELEAEPLEVPMSGLICNECVEKEEQEEKEANKSQETGRKKWISSKSGGILLA